MMAVGVLEDLRGRAEEPGINLREDGFNRWLGALRLNPQQVYSLYSLSSQPPAAASATIASNKVGHMHRRRRVHREIQKIYRQLIWAVAPRGM